MTERVMSLEHLPTMELALANSVRGGIESLTGDHQNGRRHMQESYENAQGLPPASQAIVWAYWGVRIRPEYSSQPKSSPNARKLIRAESFGDLFCIIAAQWSAAGSPFFVPTSRPMTKPSNYSNAPAQTSTNTTSSPSHCRSLRPISLSTSRTGEDVTRRSLNCAIVSRFTRHRTPIHRRPRRRSPRRTPHREIWVGRPG